MVIQALILGGVVVIIYVFWGPNHLKKKSYAGLVVGVENFGNTCYLNALIQSLAACPLLVEWLQDFTRRNIGTGDNQPVSYAIILNKMISVVNNTENANERFDFNNLACSLLSTHAHGPYAIMCSQQDIQELFQNLTEVLQHEILLFAEGATDHNSFGNHVGLNIPLSRIFSVSGSRPTIVSKMNGCSPTVVDGEKCLRLAESLANDSCQSTCISSLQSINSLDDFVFRGVFASVLQCFGCQYRKVICSNDFTCISLPLPSLYKNSTTQASISIEKLLDCFCFPGNRSHDTLTLIGGQMDHVMPCDMCDHCHMSTPTSRHTVIAKSPRCLCLHVMRSDWDRDLQMVVKNNQRITFPELLDLSPYLYRNYLKASVNLTAHMYRLVATVEHVGHSGGGHFVSFRRASPSKHSHRWFYVSDLNVTEVRLAAVLASNPYLLFYSRV